MGKPKAPAPPDYAAAAQQQGVANINSAVATNFLNQADQVGPYGTLSYSYSQPGSGKGYTTPDGQYIPQATATTQLSPEQQHLLDQNTAISTQLNDVAAKGISYVDNASSTPIDQSKLPSFASGLATPMALPNASDFSADRDKITAAYMERLKPYMDQQQQALDAKLANQGITNGSQAYGFDQHLLQQGFNDQRIAALLAGDQQQQNEFNNAMAVQGTNFNQGLASAQFQDTARQQAIQEADYFKNQPLNMLNALRSGNQVTLPQFGNVTAGSNIAPPPVYQATSDQYNAALSKYKADLAASGGILGGIASLGSSAITKFSDRRLKKNIRRIGQLASGIAVYAFNYLWDGPEEVGVMADEVPTYALGPTILGYATVNYGAL